MRRLVLVTVALAGVAIALPATAGVGDDNGGDVPVMVDTKHICVGTSPEKQGGDVDSYCVSVKWPLVVPQ